MKNQKTEPDGNYLRRNWKKIAGISVAVLLLLAFLAPAIVVKTGILSRLVNQYSGLNGRIEFQSASLSWFSQTSFEGVTIHTADGDQIGEIDSILISKSLLGLISSGIHQAEITVSNSNLKLVREADGQLNWLKILPASDSDSDQSPASISIHLTNTVITCWQEDLLEGSCKLASASIDLGAGEDGQSQVIKIDSNAETIENEVTGTMQVTGAIGLTPEGTLNELTTSLQADHAPLGFLRPLLASLEPPAFAVCVSGRAGFDYQKQDSTGQIDARFDELALAKSTPDRRMFNDSIDIPLKLDGQLFTGDKSQESRLSVTSDYGNAEISGAVAAVDSFSIESLLRQRFQVKGDFDFARFAADFPQWIQLRAGTELVEASLAFTAFSRVEGDRMRLLVDVRSDGWVAQANQRTIQWKNPIGVSLAISDSNLAATDDLTLEFVECKSDFLNLKGSGNLARGQIELRGDLALLREHLSEFLDLNHWELAGNLDGNLNWAPRVREGEDSIEWLGTVGIREFRLGDPQGKVWKEENLVLDFKTACRVDGYRLQGLQQLEVALSTGNNSENLPSADRLSLAQRKPVSFDDEYQMILDAEMTGEVKAWLQRLEPVLDLGLDVAGLVDAKAVVSVTPKTVRIRTKNNCHFKSLVVRLDEVVIDEALARTELDLLYRKDTGAITSDRLLVESRNLLLRSDRMISEVTNGERTTTLNLDTQLRADKLGSWLLPSQYGMQGIITGPVQLTSNQAGYAIDGKLESKDFAFFEWVMDAKSRRKTAQSLVEQGPATLAASMKINEPFDRIDVGSLGATAVGTQLNLKGAVKFEQESPVLDLTGSVMTDMDEVSSWLQTYVGDQVRLTGKTENAIRIAGPIFKGKDQSPDYDYLKALFPRRLAANAKINWESGTVFGLPVGIGELRTDLVQSEILMTPTRFRISKGSLVAAPKLNLSRDPYSLLIPKGKVIESAHVGREVFRTWMRYLTPLLADATEAKGSFSIALDDHLEIPFSNPAATKLKGRMLIESIEVGPGPLGQSLISVTRQVLGLIGKSEKLDSLSKKPWLQLPPQEIKVALDGGTVTHQLVQFQIGEVTIYSSGSVDFNQNINMLIVIPIAPDWFKENPVLKTVVGDAIRIPLKGKISDPKFNLDLIGGISKGVAGSALDKLLQEGTQGLINGDLLKGKGLKDDSPLSRLLKSKLLDGAAKDQQPLENREKSQADPRGGLGDFFKDQAKGFLKRKIFEELDQLKDKE